MSQMEINYFPIANEARPRDQQDIMAFPCFSLSKNKRTDIMEFQEQKTGKYIIVSPNPLYGMATVWDFDIILYFVSLIRRYVDTGQKVPEVFHVSAHDILKFCGKKTGKSQYDQLSAAIDRLTSTYIKTNIRENTIAEDEIELKEEYLRFTWLSDVTEEKVTRFDRKTGKKKKVLSHYTVRLPKWLVDGTTDKNMVLGTNPSYFKLKGGIERFLYRTARKFAGVNGKKGARYTLQHILDRSGSTSGYRRFKQHVKKAILDGNIPDYHISLYKKNGVDYIHMVEKDVPDPYKHPKSFEETISSLEVIAESPTKGEE